MPNHVCCVLTCRTKNKRDDVKFLKFPKNKELCEKWRQAIKREPQFKVTNNTRICSRHFASGRRSFDPNDTDYIPSIFPKNKCYNRSTFYQHKQTGGEDGKRTKQTDSTEVTLQDYEYSNSEYSTLPNVSNSTCTEPAESLGYTQNIKITDIKSGVNWDSKSELYFEPTDSPNNLPEEKLIIANINHDLESHPQTTRDFPGGSEELSIQDVSSVNNHNINFQQKGDPMNFNECHIVFYRQPQIDYKLIYKDIAKVHHDLPKYWSALLPRDNQLQAVQISDTDNPVVQRSLVWNEFGKLHVFIHNKPLPDGHWIWYLLNHLPPDECTRESVCRVLEAILVVAGCRVCNGNYELHHQIMVENEVDYDNEKGCIGYKEIDYNEILSESSTRINSTLRSVDCHLLVDSKSNTCQSCLYYRGELENRIIPN